MEEHLSAAAVQFGIAQFVDFEKAMAAVIPSAINRRVTDDQLVARERDGDLAVDEADRDRVPAHLHSDQAVAVDTAVSVIPVVNGSSGKGSRWPASGNPPVAN
nr:hypothetical protein [Streptomyces malaysiensis]